MLLTNVEIVGRMKKYSKIRFENNNLGWTAW